MRRAWYGLNQAFRRRIAYTGSTPDQFTVMRNLVEADAPGMTQSELTSSMTSDPNTIAALVGRMESEGLIDRIRHETDGRARRLRLKAKGHRRYADIHRIAARLQADALKALPPGRRRVFLQDLEAVAEACRAAAELTGRAG